VAERDAESAWRIAKESYLHACECVLGKKRKSDKNWIRAETWSLIDKRREIRKRKGLQDHTKTKREAFNRVLIG